MRRDVGLGAIGMIGACVPVDPAHGFEVADLLQPRLGIELLEARGESGVHREGRRSRKQCEDQDDGSVFHESLSMNRTPMRFSLRQTTSHNRTECSISTISLNWSGIPTGETTSRAAPVEEKLRTVQVIAAPPANVMLPAFKTRRRWGYSMFFSHESIIQRGPTRLRHNWPSMMSWLRFGCGPAASPRRVRGRPHPPAPIPLPWPRS